MQLRSTCIINPISPNHNKEYMAELGVHDSGRGAVGHREQNAYADPKDSATGGAELTLLPLALGRY